MKVGIRPGTVMCQMHRNRSHLVCRLALAVRSALPAVLDGLSAVPAPDALPVHLVLPVVLGGLPAAPAPDVLAVRLHRLVLFLYFYSDYYHYFPAF